MPHLQLEVTESLMDDQIRSFAGWLTDRYAAVMDTGTAHVGVTVREDASLAMGRADADAPVAFLNADIRAGRSAEQRRTLAGEVIEELHDRWAIPAANVYVVFTEHPGEDFHLVEGPLSSWSDAEATGADEPLGAE
jgi:5-carboxymethyl-2-hydroxymuconate isomerase